MNTELEKLREKKWLLWASLYAAIVIVIGGYLNFVTPYSPKPVSNPPLYGIILWAFLYFPIIVAPILIGWKVSDFGFNFNPLLFVPCAVILAFCGLYRIGLQNTWSGAVWEAFARTGEEIFFRGFVYFLILRLLSDWKKPWLWAVIGSSLLFMFVHQQLLQQTSQSPSTLGNIFVVLESFLEVFGVAVFFALIRAWTGSILPGAIAHGIIQGGILTLPFVLIIYFLFTFWALKRREQVVL